MVRYFIFIGLLFGSYLSHAQVKAFAVAKSNRTTVLVEQPLKVSITVYTKTWFTKPLDIENLQVDGAFVQSFKRTLSSIQYVNKEKYATLKFYYIIFPYRAGELEFPELKITTETPAEGDYKGVETVLKTKAFIINVQDIPNGADQDHWMVANNAYVYNKWNTDIKNLKVGDVLKRTITIKAKGTLPSFIDGAIIEDVDFGNIYNSEPQFIDERDDKAVNGKRIDSYSYLLEEEGEFTIPELEISWYNPYVKKFYKKKIAAVNINIKPNEDLAGLVALRDSLNALNPDLTEVLGQDETETDYKKWIIIVVEIILLFLLSIFLFKLISRLVRYFKKRKQAYINSEAYLFNKAMTQKDDKGFINKLYIWLIGLPADKQIYTLKQFGKGNIKLDDLLRALKKRNFSKEKGPKGDVSSIKKESTQQRIIILEKDKLSYNNSLNLN